MLRVGIEFQVGARLTRAVLPKDVDERPVRIGFGGDLDVPLPADILVYRKRGKLLVASGNAEIPLALGACALPTWFVPVPLPCTLAIGAFELAIFECVTRQTTPVSGVSHVKTPLPFPRPPPRKPPPLPTRAAEEITREVDMAARIRKRSRLRDRLRDEWMTASRETKLACITMFVTTLLLLFFAR